MRHLWIFVALVGCQQDVRINPDPKDVGLGEDTDDGLGALQPRIQVTPERLTFGDLPPNCPIKETVTITNVGDARLEVSSLELTGRGVEGYSLSDSSPFRLPPGQSKTIDVSFAALDYNPYPARLVVSSNDPIDAVVRVPVEGTGAIAAFKEEFFIQAEGGSVDILWVIDNSCSMAPKLDRVAQAMDSFIQSFVNLGLDFRLGMTTTDMFATGPGNQGAFIGKVMDSAAMSGAQIVAEFKSQVQQGAQGSADEKGLDASYKALTAPMVSAVNNRDLLRAEATLAVVVVSDEDDFSSISPSNYITWLRGMKGNPDHVSFSGLVGPNGGSCRGGLSSEASAAPRYHQVINATGGAWGDMCAINSAPVGPFLQHLSYVAAGLEYRFELSDTPTNTSPAAVTVKVDGKALPFGVIDGWTYDASTNSIVLWGKAIPDPGGMVEVRYPYDSGCE